MALNLLNRYITELFKPKAIESNSVNKYTTTKGKLYFIILSNDVYYDDIPIQFVPDSINKTRMVNHANIQTVGRNLPEYVYTGGQTKLSFQLDIYARLEDKSDVIDTVNKLEALGYSDGYNKEKYKVILVWGDMFRGEVWEVGNIQSQLTDFVSTSNFLPKQAYVNIELLLTYEENPTWEVLREEIQVLQSTDTFSGSNTNDFSNLA